jgi:hypothetical protein
MPDRKGNKITQHGLKVNNKGFLDGVENCNTEGEIRNAQAKS